MISDALQVYLRDECYTHNMKRNQIIILSIFFVVTALIYLRLMATKSDKEPEEKTASTIQYIPVREVHNVVRNMEITSYGQISPVAELEVAFEVQGRLKKGELTLKPGIRFRKGQVLYSVDANEAEQSLNARKVQLANLIITALPDIELDFPQQTNKWIDFLNKIQPSATLPELPAISSGKERMFVTSRSILSEYYNLKSLEERLRKYTYTAPFDGTVVEIYAEPGSIVNPGGRIAKIAKTGDFEVKVPINTNLLERYRDEGTATFSNAKGKVVGTGKIIRVSDVINQRTQSADVYYSIQPVKASEIYNGMFLNASIKQRANLASMAIPTVALKDGKVLILKDEKLIERSVENVSSKPDTVFVTGLKDGEILVLEPVQKDSQVKKYKGIKR